MWNFKEWFAKEHRYVVAKPVTRNLRSHIRKAERLLNAMKVGNVREVRELQQWLIANDQPAPESEYEAESLLQSLKNQHGPR